MPLLIPFVEAGNFNVDAPGAATAEVATTTAAPGSRLRIVRTAFSSSSNPGAVPSVGSWNEKGFADDGGVGRWT